MTPVRLLPEAEGELRATARFYEAAQQRLGRALIKRSAVRVDLSLNTRWLPVPSVAKFASEQSRDFPTESTIERDPTRYWSSLSVTVGEDRDSGVRARSHRTTGCSERGMKLILGLGGQRVAELGRYTPALPGRSGF
jgi:hypothetical protein